MTTLLLIVAGFSAGFVDAIAGGGGLISLPALLALGLPPADALGTNKAIGICSAAASSYRYGRSGVFAWRATAPLVLAGALFGGAGAFVATLVDPKVLRPILLVGLVAVAAYVSLHRKFGADVKPEKKARNLWIHVLVIVIGFYDGFFGPGTGTFLMMTFVILNGDLLLAASGKSRLINLGTNFGAITIFVARGHAEILLALPGSLAAIVGSSLGASLAVQKGAAIIRPVFLIVTWGIIAKVAFDLLR